jgi:hypothetical protein
MSQLTLSSIPGFYDLADGTIAAGQPATDDAVLKISHNAKFGALRCEIIYMGFYHNGDTIPWPASPCDSYQYQAGEVMFLWSIYSNRSPVAPFTPGQQLPPPQSSSQPQNGLYNFPGGWDINDLTGVVTLRTTYYSGGGAEIVNNDGIIKVYAFCQRSSQAVAN